MAIFGGCLNRDRYLLSSDGQSVWLSLTESGARADAEVVSGLRGTKEGTSAVFSWSCGTSRAKVAEVETSWV